MKPRATARLTAKLERNLIAYATVATAAGVAMSAMPPTVDAEVVYTRKHQLIRPDRSYDLDLNNDGITDFKINDIYYAPSMAPFTDGLAASGYNGNSVVIDDNQKYSMARALGPDVKIGDARRVHSLAWLRLCRFKTSNDSWHRGRWRDDRPRYLGLKFQIDGEPHFAWARLRMKVTDAISCRLNVTLTGFAYETVSDKPIVAGDKGTGASLGHLALGAAGRNH